MNKHFSIVEGLNSFINSSLHKTSFVLKTSLVLLSLSLATSLWADDKVSTLTFTAACGGSGTADDGVSWTVSSDGSESTFDSSKGIHYGTGSAAVQYITLSTSDISGTITKVVVNASTASGVSATVSVTVGGSAFGGAAQSLSATATDYTFDGSASGEIVVTITKPSSASKALYCKSVAVTYSTSGGSTKTLESIAVQTPPTKTTYYAGETFDPTGLVITRTYNSGDPDTYAYEGHTSDFSFSPSTSTPLTMSNTSITITYGGKTTTQDITVSAALTYTVTWMANGTPFGSAQTDVAGTALTNPGTPASSVCDGSKVFVGWTEDGTYADPTDAPDDLFTSVSGKTIPIGGITYYAVFATSSGSGSSNKFTLYTGELTAGDYLLVYDNGAMNTTVTSDRLQYTTVSPSSNTITTTDATIIWHIAASGEYWTIYNAGESQYAASTGAKNKAQLLDDGTDDKALWSCSSTSSSETYDFVNKKNTDNDVNATLRRNGDYGFACYGTGTGGELALYKKTSSASYSDYAVSCTTYTVTATTNNPSFGSVSVDHYTITATPATGYVADGCTVSPAANATVTQNGNIYTVHPSSDCTVQINFRAAASYTVTLIDNGKTYTETAYEGTPYALPEEHKSTCPDATFLGWATGEYTNHYTGTSTNPGYTAGGEEVNITEPTTFVAVYGNVELGDNYAALKAEAELTSNANYVVAAYYSSKDYIVKATTSNDRIDSYQTSLTLADSGNEITDAKLVWRINVLNAATKTVTFYNADINKYLSINGDNALCFDDEPFAFTYAVDESGNAATWVFTSTTNTDYKLAFYSTYHQFNAYTTGSDLYLYKQLADNESYTSHPNCCHEPATPLAISAEPTTLVGSGVTTITLEGGNNKNITWSTTGGTPSGQSNTGATLTLSTPGTYTVTATQPDDETDPDNVICGATVTTNITVKAQWTITLKTKDDGTASTYDTQTVTDGETYTLPDLSEDYTCEDGYAFAGWATSESATAVEKTAGSVITASATTTWWAVWQSSSGDTETVTKWEKVSTTSDLVANATFVLSYNDKAMGSAIADGWAAKNDVDQDADKTYVAYPSSTTGVQVFTLKGSTGAWKFYSAATSQWLAMTEAGKISWTDTEGDAATFTITLSGSDAYIYNNAATSNEYLKYNAGSPRFKGYAEGSCAFASLYKNKGNTVTISSSSGVSYFVNNEHCSSGAMIKADGAWITAANGQKVKAIIPVVAKNFDASSTLSVSNISDSHFTATLAETAIPAGSAGLTTTLTVEYLPDASDVLNATTITLSAGDVTKTITVNGRSLPDEFLMIAKKTLWYAVPANMNEGAGQYDGVNVVPNDGTEPDKVAVAPSTVIYSLKSVANSRYATAGQYVRLAGLGNKGLWANGSASTTTLYNNAPIADSNDGHYEWQLATTDGIHYTISNPAHPDAAAGRRLALGGAGGEQYGLYKESTTFFLVPAGCTSQPQEVNVSARRTDATFSWVSNASSFTIDIYTDEAMAALAKSETATSSPYMMLGLNETTEYWFKLTPDGSEDCAVTGKFKTTGPVIDIVEWEENKAIIFVDKDEELHPRIVIDGEVEHGAGSGATATDLFFSKYFEGSGDMKLVAIFNGTTSDISLANYSLYTKNCSAPKKEENIASSTFSGTTEYPISALGTIKAGQEIIFFSRPTEGQAATSCSKTFLKEKAALNGEDQNPRWIECDNDTYYGSEKFPLMQFNGNDAICLTKNSSLIDIIGTTGDPGKVKNCANRLNDLGWAINVKNIDYGKASDDASFNELFDASSKNPSNDSERRAVLAGFGVNLDDEYIDLTTARCILFRDKTVTSGDAAVALNTGAEFATCQDYTYSGQNYKSEWNGRAVCMDAAMQTAAGVGDDGRATCNSYQDLGIFNYSEYYKEWNTILPGVILDDNVRDPEAKTYEIEIPNLAKYSCLNLKFQLTDKDDVSHVYTEQEVQVPILVKDEHTTVDQIFNSIVKTDGGDPLYDESIQRCQTCDVVVLGGGLLTKATDGTTHDAPEIGNLKVYPGGKVVVPEGTTYTVNSLALRRQEDALSLAQVEGTLAIKQPNSTFLDIRIDPSNWHYFTLPYDVNVSDITFVDGTPAAIGTDFRIGTYDGEHRAATQSASWVYLNSEDVLKAGLGYIIGLPGSGKVQRELRFPMANEVITAEKENKVIAGFHAWGGDKSDEELRPNHKGWNLIGAPYLTYYETELTTPLPTGKLVEDTSEDPWQGHYVRNDDGLRYIVVPQDNGWSEYKQVAIANYHMAPFTSYFVQIGGSDPAADQTISYTASQAGKLSIVRRAVQEEVEDNHEVWFGVELVNADGLKDETALLISDKFTDDYDIMDDLVKMRGQYYQYAQITTKPVIASRNLKGEMAFNALPDSTAAAGVPLNFFAAKDGDYRFTISGNYPLDEVKSAYLYDNDNATQKWHNLMESDYTFTTKRGDNTTRFMLAVTVERKQPEITTALDNMSSKLTLTTINRTLVLSGLTSESDIYVYDVSGKLLSTGQYNASASGVFRTTVENVGVYFVKVCSKDGQQTLQTIVY